MLARQLSPQYFFLLNDVNGGSVCTLLVILQETHKVIPSDSVILLIVLEVSEYFGQTVGPINLWEVDDISQQCLADLILIVVDVLRQFESLD